MGTDEKELLGRLSARFPDVAAQHISTVVTAEQERLVDRPIRDFIAVLVERAVVMRLRNGAVPLSD